jgi:glucose/mannose-6-phosphate isomerase
MKITDFVKKYDLQNQFEVLINSYKQIEYAWNNTFSLGSLKRKKFNSIVVTGLGGSAISADLMQNFLSGELKLPLIVNRNYYLPGFFNEKTLLIVSSYSGNTEETISVFKEALKKTSNIICITTGGVIEKTAISQNIAVVKLLTGFQPRYALGLSFFSLLKVLQELEVINNQTGTVKKIIKLWKESGEKFSSEENYAFKLAEKIIGHIPIIYSTSDLTASVGYRLKCQFNENSKLHAYANQIPELNHNEIVGWESFSEKQLNAVLINVLDKNYHPQIKKRLQITSEIASKNKIDILNLESSQKEFKVRLMDLIYLGDWITYYTAILRGYDPSEINNIDYLKKKLSGK